MKKEGILKIVLVVIVFMSQFLLISDARAEDGVGGKTGEMEVTVGIGKVKEKDKSKDKDKDNVYKPEVSPTINDLLPQTNEMINTLLIILGIICLFIVLLGLTMMKRTYEERDYVYL